MAEGIEIGRELRKHLKKPLGQVIRSKTPRIEEVSQFLKGSRRVVSVGDATTRNLISIGIVPSLRIIDLREKRQALTAKVAAASEMLYIRNEPGQISFEAISALKDALASIGEVLILVEGEEDLLTLPVVAMAPIGSVVFYGQPDEGMVAVRVDEKIRSWARKMLISIGFKEDELPKY